MEYIYDRRGLTLIELLVVVAIIGFILVVAITSQSSFNTSLLLKNTAFDIALSLRDAETYGLGSRALSVSPNTGYGVYFTVGSNYILFADTYPVAPLCHPISDSTLPSAEPGNCSYDVGNDQIVTTYRLGNGFTINRMCAYNGTNAGDMESCTDQAINGGVILTSLDIVFARPNPDVFVRVNGLNTVYTSACIRVTSPQGGKSFVTVAPSGEIGISATDCPTNP